MIMQLDELHSRINTAVNWNAFSYTIFKLTSTALTFVLFDKLSTIQFALWTGINSLIYLFLVWADCGMRKAIPAFFPHVPEGRRKYFIFTLVGIYTALLNITCPLALWIVARYADQVNLPMDSSLLVASGILFFGHGLEMLLQTIFHAYLWHKTYNTLLASIQISYMLVVIGAAFLLPPSLDMVYYIILYKGIASLLCVILSLYIMARRLPAYALDAAPVSRDFIKRFLKHASLMWGATVLKSLTERNITVPFVTYCLGPVLGNILKVAQDAASLLQRLIFRTIGTTDTSLFAYLKGHHTVAENPQIFQAAFTQLATKLTYFTVPLIGLVWFMHCQVDQQGTSGYGFQLFVIIAIGLLLEMLLTPYERMLEVHGDYTELAYAYLVYVIACGVLFALMAYSFIGLVPFILGLCIIRLISMGIMAYAVYRRYKLIYPYKNTVLLLIVVLVLMYLLHLITRHVCGNALVKVLSYIVPFTP